MTELDPTKLGLRSCGTHVRIFSAARITRPDQVTIGDYVIIDDFVMLQGGSGLQIGDYVHLASFASITGGGKCEIGDFSGVASGARLLTGTDVADGSGLMGPQMPTDKRCVVRPGLRVGRLAFIGANAVVHPGVTVGEGAVVGALSLVTHDVEPWTINVGVPARPVRKRPSKTMIAMARAITRNRQASAD